MQVTLPSLETFSHFTRDDYLKLDYLVKQGRPLFLDGRTIRPASWWEMINPWNGRAEQNRAITLLFQEYVIKRQHANPRDNRKSWVLQAANLWGKQIKDKPLRTAYSENLLYMKLGLDPNSAQFKKDDKNAEFVAWARKHHQHHFVSFFGHELRYSELSGSIMLPFETEEGTVWRKWLDVKDDPTLFSPHPIYHMDNEWASTHLGQDGYVIGESWPNDPRPEDQTKLDDWATWKPYKKSLKQSWGETDAIEFRFWMTEEPGLRDNHFYLHLLRADGSKYSAGEYRPKNFDKKRHPEGFTFRWGAKTYKERMERPDDSTFMWSAPPKTRKFRFAAPEGLPEQMLGNMKQALIDDKMYYQGPETICQQIYERLLERKFDFRMSFWKLFASHVKQSYGMKLASYFPEPVQKAASCVSWGVTKMRNGISYIIPQCLKDAADKVSGVAVAPLENIIASFIGGRRVADDAVDLAPGPAVVWSKLFSQRQQASHPYVAYHLILRKCEDYAAKVRDGLNPPGCKDKKDRLAWLDLDIHRRLHPYSIVQDISEPLEECMACPAAPN